MQGGRERSRRKRKGLDETDCRMIELLQKDGRLSNTVIAKELGISEATVRTRLKRLLDEEIIAIVAVGNPVELGFQIAGKVDIQIDIKQAASTIEKLKRIKELHYLIQTTGATDITADFHVTSLDELRELLTEKIGKIDGVVSTKTSLMVQYVKDQYDWGTA